jgi:hypothetical protein
MSQQRFDAGDDLLTYDFSKYNQGAGEIPEPTTAQIEAFVETVRQTMPTKTNEDGETVVDVDSLADKVEQGSDLEAILYSAVDAVTSGEITAEKIQGLPFRTQRRFLGWLMGVMLDPEA